MGTTGLNADLFNDDSLGRCLDQIHEYGTTKLFSELALPIAIEFGIPLNKANFDTTSISLYEQYDEKGYKERDVVVLNKSIKNKTNTEININNVERNLDLPNNGTPEYGHAKNKRTDLE